MITLRPEELEITSKDVEGWLVASHAGMTVALDIAINEDLKQEGIARELVNRIQNMRKDAGFEVTDKIKVKIQKDGVVEHAVDGNYTYIKNETLATSLELVEKTDNGIEVDFDDVKTRLSIKKD
jgi:isoleucyl-tRNA synthetase